MKKLLLKNSILNVGGYIYLLFASLISVPIVLSHLGERNFGILLLFTSLVPLASTLDLGISQALIRQLALPDKDIEYKRRYWQTGLWVYLATGIIAAIAFSGAMFWMFFSSAALRGFPLGDFLWINLFITLTIIINHFSSALMSLPQADHRYDIYNLRTMIAGTGNTFVTAILVLFSTNISLIVFCQFVFYLLTFFSLVRYAENKFHKGFLSAVFNRHEFRQVISFGLKNFVGNFANQLNLQSSKYVLGGLLSAEAVTVFGIPQNIVMKAAGGISQLTLAIFPLSASLATKEKFASLKKLSFFGEVLALVMGLVGIAATYLYGYQFLVWWLRDPIIVAKIFPLLKVMSLFLALNALTPLPSVVLNGLNYPQLPSFTAVLTAVFNLLFIIILVPSQGAIGAANATLWSSIITVPIFLVLFITAMIRYEKKL